MNEINYGDLPYTRCFVPEEGGGFSCYAKELHGCMSQGETFLEAYSNLSDAIQGWCEAAKSQGQEVPPPNSDFWITQFPADATE